MRPTVVLGSNAIDTVALAAQIDRIEGSAIFSNSPVLRRMFRHIAERTIARDAPSLKGYALGLDLWQRGPDFDPSLDSIVRKQAGRLRQKLSEYYRSEGCNDGLVIEVPTPGYRMRSHWRASQSSIALASPPIPATATPHNLPAALSPLIGRESDIAKLAGRFTVERLITLAGTGGMGKTRMAIEVARSLLSEFPSGVWFVALDRLSDAGSVAEALLGAIGVANEGGRSPTEIIVRHFSDARALIVLDNAEHLLTAVADLACALLEAAAGVRILVTSRAALGLAEEHVFRVPALTAPTETAPDATAAMSFPAVELLTRRIDAATGGFVLRDEDAPVIATICRRLDGIPLALELVAARFAVLSPEDISAGLAERIELLARPRERGPERQRTLRATLDWSHALLEPDEQRLFRRLSVFAGGWSLESAAFVTEASGSDDAALIIGLGSLVDKSLVIAVRGHNGLRYRMIETTRAYAADHYRADDEGGCEYRMATYLHQQLTQASTEFDRVSSEDFLRRYGPEIDNIRSSMAWAAGPNGDAALLAGLAGYSVQLFCECGMINEARRWTERARPGLDDDYDPGAIAEVRLALAFRFATGVAATREIARDSVRAARRSGKPVLLARCLLTSVQPLRFWDPPAADVAVAEAMALCRALAPSKTLAFALAASALSAALAGDHDRAAAEADEAVAMMRGYDYRFGLPWACLLKCECRVLARSLADAVAAGFEAHDAAQSSGIRALTGMASASLAACLALSGEWTDAVAWASLALADADDVQEPVITAGALETLALYAVTYDPPRAARLAGFADAQRTVERAQRRPSEAGVWQRLGTELDAALRPAQRAALVANGATLTAEAAVQLASLNERAPHYD